MRSTIVLSSIMLAVAAIAQTPNITGNCNVVGNNNVVCSSVRSEFSPELGDQLIKSMPDKKKTVALETVGGNKDQKVGNDVEAFLVKHGYSVQRTITGILAPPPDQFITLQIGNSQYQVIVAPSAH